MIQGKKVLAFIPARGGSKGIPKKNIIDLCGKPLIDYTIQEAKKSSYVDTVLVSTDSIEIAEVARKSGSIVPFLRPGYLSSDNSKTIDAVIYTVGMLQEYQDNYDILLLLQPTQPLRSCEDIDRALEIFIQHKMEGLVSVCKIKESPVLMRRINEQSGKLENLLEMGSTIRRQDMPQYFKVNGCIYINLISDVKIGLSFNDNKIPYIMPQNRSIDIDSYEDLKTAERLLKLGKDDAEKN